MTSGTPEEAGSGTAGKIPEDIGSGAPGRTGSGAVPRLVWGPGAPSELLGATGASGHSPEEHSPEGHPQGLWGAPGKVVSGMPEEAGSGAPGSGPAAVSEVLEARGASGHSPGEHSPEGHPQGLWGAALGEIGSGMLEDIVSGMLEMSSGALG